MQMTNFGSPTVAAYYVVLYSQPAARRKGCSRALSKLLIGPSLMRKRLQILGSRYDWFVPLPEIPNCENIPRNDRSRVSQLLPAVEVAETLQAKI